MASRPGVWGAVLASPSSSAIAWSFLPWSISACACTRAASAVAPAADWAPAGTATARSTELRHIVASFAPTSIISLTLQTARLTSQSVMPMTLASRSAPERLRKAESHPSKNGSPSGLPFSAITCGVLELASRQRVDPTTRSEVEPECELEHPRGLRGEREEEVRVSGDSPARATINATVGVAEVDVVEDVERLSAKLTLKPLRDPEVLKHGKVGVPEFRATE